MGKTFKNIITKEFLQEEYIEKNRRPKQLAKLIGCDLATIYTYLDFFGFKIRKRKKILNLSKEFLIEEYINKKRTIDDLSIDLHCRSSTIKTYLKKYNINIRKTGPIIEDLVGKIFGRLIVIKYICGSKDGSIWECKCSCQNQTIKNISAHCLKRGSTKSCGCLTKEIGKSRTGKNHPNFKGYEEIGGQYWYGVKSNAKIRNLEFNITLEEAWIIFLEQNKKCMLSGQKLIFASRCSNNKQTASLDRIDSTKGYIKNNCQWVHKDINWAKQTMSNREFIKMCELVYKNSNK